jgi:tRNA pseudouridine32 synthase/23S rRNA pseudouridine746 synthase
MTPKNVRIWIWALLVCGPWIAFSTTNAFSFVSFSASRISRRLTSPVHVPKVSRLYQAAASLSGEEINQRLQQTLARLREKDRQSKALQPSDLKIVHEDEHIIVVDKPSGVLTVPSDKNVPSLAQAVFDHCQPTEVTLDQMVVHRLGMDTSGLIVLAKTMDTVRQMNALFRTRKITRQYEALVVGHLPQHGGLISLPLMRDYEHPPYMRVSTEAHQAALADLDPAVVGKKLLEAPKAAMTHFVVEARETLTPDENDDDDEDNVQGLDVSRLTLTSISGRTHQLNVHLAAVGHPIVQDTVYGWQGEAAANGGLETPQAPDGTAASEELQQAVTAATKKRNMCVHAKYIRFRHPATKETVEFTSPAPF